jgi:hypothetical protein
MPTVKNDIAVLVHSCDRYELLYPAFNFFFNKYWDFAIPANYYFATEEKTVSFPRFQNIQSGKGEWSDRLRYLLENKVSERWVIYFQEDMWLTKPVNARFFQELFRLAADQNWLQVKLHSTNVYTTIPTGIFIEGFNVAKLDNQRSGYLMSHQVTLWDRKFLLQQLLKSEHPWRNERRGTRRLRKLNPGLYHIDYFAANGTPPINANDHPVQRSEYQTISVNAVLNDSALPFIHEMLDAGAEYKPYAEQLLRHYTNGITHDGRPKPRKVDIIKRIKNRLTGKS